MKPIHLTILLTLFFQCCIGKSMSRKESLTFLTFGAWGINNSNQEQVAKSMATWAGNDDADFVLTLGDNFDMGVDSVDDSNWEKIWKQPYLQYTSLKVPWYVTAGNRDHDEGDIKAQIDFSATDPYWSFPSTYYTFIKYIGIDTYIQFIIIDSSNINDIEDQPEQLAWFTETIATSVADWIIVASHHSIYSAGENGGKNRVKWLRTYILPLMEKYNAALYLNGHDTNLQYISLPGSGVHHVVSASAQEVSGDDQDQADELDSLGASRYFREGLGFAGVKIQGNYATIKFIDEFSNVSHETVLVNPKSLS